MPINTSHRERGVPFRQAVAFKRGPDMSWTELLGQGAQSFLPWVDVYHRLARQRDAEGGLDDDDDAELLDTLEESLAPFAALACERLNARLSTREFSLRVAVRALGLVELAVDDSALLDDGLELLVGVEHAPLHRWYHFTAVVLPRRASDGLRQLRLVASHGSRTLPFPEER
jgi:hypothetical protein